MTCNQIVAVYISGTSTPIRDATVTCTGHAPKPTNRYGMTMFAVEEGATHNIRANADGYVISDAYTIIGCQDTLTIKLKEEEPIQITVKRPTWVSMVLKPVQAEYPTGEELQVRGYLRFETEPYTEGEIWLIDADAGEIISERYPMGVSGFYVLKWTPSTYKPEGYNVTVGCDAFVSASNPLGAWSVMPNGFTKHINVVKGTGGAMTLVLPNLNGKLFESNTIKVNSDYATGCTDFTFQIRNDGNVRTGAWYKVNVVGGGNIYSDTIGYINPGGTSPRVSDTICAAGVVAAGGLPAGTYTIKVEIGPTGEEATDTVTDTLYVIEEAALSVTTYQPFLTIWEEGAKVKGSVANTNGLSTDVGFEYGKTTTYGNTTWAEETTTPIDFFKDLSGLEPGTLYHFRAIATNNVESAYGVDKSFTTIGLETGTVFEILLPNTTLLEQDEVMAHDEPDIACTRFSFEIKNKWYTGLTAWYTVSEGGYTIYSENIIVPKYSTSDIISNLICAEPLLPGGLPLGEHKILVEVGQVGQARDTHLSETLTVLEYGTPTVDTIGVEDPTFSSATLVGTLKDVGIEARVGFEYGLLYGSMNTVWREGYIRGGEYKVTISGLERNEVYMFRAVAEADGMVGYGEERSFLAAPAVIDVISLGWNLEDAKIDEYNAHLQITNLSEDKRYWLSLASAQGHVYVQVNNVTSTKETEIKTNITQDLLEEYGYSLTCRVYDSDITDAILTQSYIVPPIDLELHTNIGGPITDIPTTIKTETNYPFIIQIDNTGEKDREAGVIFVFKGVDLGPMYVFEYPLGDISGMDTTIIPAGESVGYEIMINLPNEAVPTGATSAKYDLSVLLPVFA